MSIFQIKDVLLNAKPIVSASTVSDISGEYIKKIPKIPCIEDLGISPRIYVHPRDEDDTIKSKSSNLVNLDINLDNFKPFLIRPLPNLYENDNEVF